MLQGKDDVYETELFEPIVKKIEEISGKGYQPSPREAGEEKSQAFKSSSKPGFGESPAGEFGAGECILSNND